MSMLEGFLFVWINKNKKKHTYTHKKKNILIEHWINSYRSDSTTKTSNPENIENIWSDDISQCHICMPPFCRDNWCDKLWNRSSYRYDTGSYHNFRNSKHLCQQTCIFDNQISSHIQSIHAQCDKKQWFTDMFFFVWYFIFDMYFLVFHQPYDISHKYQKSC